MSGPPERQRPLSSSTSGVTASGPRGGMATGMPPARSMAFRYVRPRAISARGGSPSAARCTSSATRTSDVVTPIRGAAMRSRYGRGHPATTYRMSKNPGQPVQREV